ncbi:hypothetical protein E8E13_002724 [Curvularia kusanoi]|uniref:Uncharacterized protein n=1 Tax=Curvularia kusanoi TaxID=90978 RepID=A0A9P4W6D7_CURKU|nr:hypothetical protein E8E13_002724 [Curvularia kusanoi]
MPEPQRQSVGAQSNRYNISLKHYDISTLFNWIDVEHELNDISYITYLMCTYPMYSELGQAYGKTHDFPWNLFRWSFKGLTHDYDLPRTTGESQGTIEFRQPPGSVDAASTKLWVNSAVSFIQGALMSGHTLDGTKTATLDDLRKFLINGAIQSGVKDHSMLSQLFDSKSKLPSGEFEVRQLTPYDLSKIHSEYTQLGGSYMQLKFARRLASRDKSVGRLPPRFPLLPDWITNLR